MVGIGIFWRIFNSVHPIPIFTEHNCILVDSTLIFTSRCNLLDVNKLTLGRIIGPDAGPISWGNSKQISSRADASIISIADWNIWRFVNCLGLKAKLIIFASSKNENCNVSLIVWSQDGCLTIICGSQNVSSIIICEFKWLSLCIFLWWGCWGIDLEEGVRAIVLVS